MPIILASAGFAQDAEIQAEIDRMKAEFEQCDAACQMQFIKKMQDSHIDGNVPPKDQFDRFMKRDLLQYFDGQGTSHLSVSYELLRDGPTQAGTSFPKYYAWVTIAKPDGAVFSQGAVRTKAINKQGFAVTDFVTADDINANPASLDMVLPRALIPKARSLAKNASAKSKIQGT